MATKIMTEEEAVKLKIMDLESRRDRLASLAKLPNIASKVRSDYNQLIAAQVHYLKVIRTKHLS